MQTASEKMGQRREMIALAIVLIIIIGLPAAALGYQFGLRPALARGVQEVEIVGRLPQDGGWSAETVRVEVGKPVRLRVTSVDVVHGFAIGKLGIDAGWIYPGQPKVVEFTPQRAGRYTFYCTTWCSDGHWRMRGTLEVYDPQNPAAVDTLVDPPQTDWQAEKVNLDAPHLADDFPLVPPSAQRGAEIWARTSGLPQPAPVLAQIDLRRQTPAHLFALLRDNRINGMDLAPLAKLAPADLWNVVAYLWREGTPADSLVLGQRLFETNCTPCHGEKGDGKGPAADALTASTMTHEMAGMHGPQSPANFTDLRSAAGASAMVYYGKLVRGGMGTGMPYWGSIFTDREMWALVDYLRTFLFK